MTENKLAEKLGDYASTIASDEDKLVFPGRKNMAAFGAVDGAADGAADDAADSGEAKPQELEVPDPRKWDELIDAETKRLPNMNTDWGSSARKYEWKEEYGDVAPPDPKLEMELFKHTARPSAGDNMDTLKVFKVDTEGHTELPPVYEFSELNLHPTMMENLKLAEYKFPTPIQCWTIPAVAKGNDVVSIAQTGSGKTGAYLIPVVSKLMGKANKLCKTKPNPVSFDPNVDAIQAEPLVLILCPTRELAIQIFEEARRMTYRSKLRASLVYGGAPRPIQISDLKLGCDILIGTPGRLRDVLENFPHVLSLRRLRFTIVDEADELIGSDSFAKALNYILETSATNVNDDHQYMMFSATFPKAIRDMVAKYLTDDHIKIKVGRIGSTHSNIHQVVAYIDETRKDEALLSLLTSLGPRRVLIFANTQAQVDLIDRMLYHRGLPCTQMSSSMGQRERERSLAMFKNGRLPIMTTTSVAGRGLDIGNIMHIVNYDLPSAMHGGIDEYIHRIGRTARIGNTGQATSFWNEGNEDIAEDLAKVMLESSHKLPDCLEKYAPADGVLRWDEEDKQGDAAFSGAFGGNAWEGGGNPLVDQGNSWVQTSGTFTNPAKTTEDWVNSTVTDTGDDWNNTGANDPGAGGNQSVNW